MVISGCYGRVPTGERWEASTRSYALGFVGPERAMLAVGVAVNGLVATGRR
jgi:hypothetical protein